MTHGIFDLFRRIDRPLRTSALPSMVVALLICAVMLGGCTTLGSTVSALLSGNSVATSAPQTIKTAEKALTVAHLAYQAIGISLKTAAESGLLKGDNAAKAETLYDEAGAALDAANQADEAANAQGVFDKVAAAEDFITQVKALIPSQ